MQSISVFADIAKFADFWWKNADFSRTEETCHVIHIFFGSCLGKVLLCQVHHCRICVTDFRKGAVHSTSCKFSTWWKFGLYFVYIFIADWNFLTKFCSSDPSFNGNILASLYLKSEISYYIQVLRHGVSWKLTLRIPLDKWGL